MESARRQATMGDAASPPAAGSTMEAAVQGGYGSADVLHLARITRPEIAAGVCSMAKLDLVRSLGADHVIDYATGDFADGVHHYDLILDIAGNPSLSRLRRALAPTGTAVLVGGEEGAA